tara:strand:+ start:299 stop:529 length:231 start_codon:yes stop_codon:yes gene_type:complete
MIPKSLLLGMLKPLLPKLEGFLKNQDNLKTDEFADIRMNVENKEIIIQIVAISREPNKDGFHEVRRVLQDINSKDL